MNPSPGTNRLELEFLYLDVSKCTRCRETDTHLEEALSEVARLLHTTHRDVEVRKIHVQSEEQARALGLVSSPTIRLNGRDIALGGELKESVCESCGGVCGEEGIGCRVWTYQGQEYTAAPKAMIVDAILREVYGGSANAEDRPRRSQDLSENLKRFFAAKRRAVGNTAGCCG
jgi:hypothetical protein